jgi:hypothetical protein
MTHDSHKTRYDSGGHGRAGASCDRLTRYRRARRRPDQRKRDTDDDDDPKQNR